MRLAVPMLGRDIGRCVEGCVCVETNILLMVVLWLFKYHWVSWCSSYRVWLLPIVSCLLGFILQLGTGRYIYPN